MKFTPIFDQRQPGLVTGYRAEVLIQLRAVVDPSQPILKATPLDGYGLQYTTVRIDTPHPVWRGAELRRDHFRVVETVEVYA